MHALTERLVRRSVRADDRTLSRQRARSGDQFPQGHVAEALASQGTSSLRLPHRDGEGVPSATYPVTQVDGHRLPRARVWTTSTPPPLSGSVEVVLTRSQMHRCLEPDLMVKALEDKAWKVTASQVESVETAGVHVDRLTITVERGIEALPVIEHDAPGFVISGVRYLPVGRLQQRLTNPHAGSAEVRNVPKSGQLVSSGVDEHGVRRTKVSVFVPVAIGTGPWGLTDLRQITVDVLDGLVGVFVTQLGVVESIERNGSHTFSGMAAIRPHGVTSEATITFVSRTAVD